MNARNKTGLTLMVLLACSLIASGCGSSGGGTALQVVSHTPAAGAVDVAPAAAVTAVFNQSVEAATINAATFILEPAPPAAGASAQAAVAATVSYNAATLTANLTPAADLAYGTTYAATVTTGVRDAGGQALAAPVSWTFSTAAAPPPEVYSFGEFSVDGTCFGDLDEGIGSSSETPLPEGAADFQWDMATDVLRYFAPRNGAVFSRQGAIDYEAVTYDDLLAATYSADQIVGSNDASNQIPTGTVIFYQTSAGRYGKLVITNYAYILTMRWLTFDNS